MHNFRSHFALVATVSVALAGAVTGVAIELAAVGGRPGAHPAGLVAFGLLTTFAVAAVACVALIAARHRASAQAAQAAQATQATSRFVAAMSHELRTPLQAVIGFAELLDSGRGGPLSARQREYVQIIRASSDHLLTLANDALDISAIEAGQLRVEPLATDAEAVASECLSSLRALADERHVTLALDADAAEPVVLDPARLRQVILNYTANAIRFTPAGGRITLRVRRQDNGLQVEVADTGVGISPADQARVFDAFVRAGSRAGGGSGLGLAVTRQIVEAQGGEVSVSSRPGAGSTFRAWLPAGAYAPQPAPVITPDLFSSAPEIQIRGPRRRPRHAPDARAVASR